MAHQSTPELLAPFNRQGNDFPHKQKKERTANKHKFTMKKKHMKEIIGTPDEHYKHYINVNHP